MRTDIAKHYAKQLRPSSLIEIAEWCEVSAKAVEGHGEPGCPYDAQTYRDTAKNLRKLAKAAESE